AVRLQGHGQPPLEGVKATDVAAVRRFQDVGQRLALGGLGKEAHQEQAARLQGAPQRGCQAPLPLRMAEKYEAAVHNRHVLRMRRKRWMKPVADLRLTNPGD